MVFLKDLFGERGSDIELGNEAHQTGGDGTGGGKEEQRAEEDGATLLTFGEADDAFAKRDMPGHGQ